MKAEGQTGGLELEKTRVKRAFYPGSGLSKLLASEFLGKKTKPSVELTSSHGKGEVQMLPAVPCPAGEAPSTAAVCNHLNQEFLEYSPHIFSHS